MMNTHSTVNARRSAAPSTVALATGQAMHLGRLGGELTVLEGRVWLTRGGDLGDHRVEAGERLRLAAGENAVIEPWDGGHAASVKWEPRRQGFVGAVLSEPLRALAWALGALAGGFDALARRAAAGACRAQGCVSGGDSMAT
jgi:ferric-dicitrate binding protein FerR (iron transport regulator)